jgi:tripartite-type tricarboxylate transporter receptor subunit TctC
MTIPRRQLVLAVAAAAASLFPGVLAAQSYPSRPVRLIVGFPAGGPADVFSRVIAQRLSETLGQQFVVENRPGAAGATATELVARAAADGYTLLQLGPPQTTQGALSDKLGYDVLRDIVPVAGIARSPNVMVLHPSIPARTVPEFIAYGRSSPAPINMASSGNGTVTHLAGELFKHLTGVSMQHVPYRGSAPALTDLLGGRVAVMFENVPSSIEHIRSGKLAALAVTTSERVKALPDVPSLSEFLPGYEASTWFGVGAPKGTPPDIVEALNAAINAGLNDPAVTMRIAELGGEPMIVSPATFRDFIRTETTRWKEVITSAGIKAN